MKLFENVPNQVFEWSVYSL